MYISICTLALHPITTPTEVESYAQHTVRNALASLPTSTETSSSKSSSTSSSIPVTELISGLTQLTTRHEQMLKQQMETMDVQQVTTPATTQVCTHTPIDDDMEMCVSIHMH